MKENEKIEIYALSKKIDKISVKNLKNEGQVKITVDLSNVEKEQKSLDEKNLISPIKEQAQFSKIQVMKEARMLLEELEDSLDNHEMILTLQDRVKEGEAAIDYLMRAYRYCALKTAKNWIHNDRLNTVEDWLRIIDCALYDAIITYNLSIGTQFTTYLTTIVKRDCKENKCKSSIVSVNPSAMHKSQVLKKAEEQVLAEGGSIDDDYAVAKAMGRDVSTPEKLRRFREMRMDMQMISPTGMSMESSAGDGSRTLGECIGSDYSNGDDLLLINDYKNRMKNFYQKLPEDYQKVIRIIVNEDAPLKENELIGILMLLC